MISLMKLFDWRRCAIVTSMEQYGLSVAKEFMNYATELEYDVLEHVMVDGHNITQDLLSIKQRNYKVIFVVALYVSTEQLLKAAHEQGMLGSGSTFSWVFSESTIVEISEICTKNYKKECLINEAFECSDPNNQPLESCNTYCVSGECNDVDSFCENLNGTLAVVPMIGRGEKWDNFLSYWKGNMVDGCYEKGTETEDILRYIYIPYILDALDAIVLAFSDDRCGDKNSQCAEVLDTLQFEGATGRVFINTTRNTPFDILNLTFDKNLKSLMMKPIGVWTNEFYVNSTDTSLNKCLPEEVSYNIIGGDVCLGFCEKTFNITYAYYHESKDGPDTSLKYNCACYKTNSSTSGYEIILSNDDIKWSYDTKYPEDGSIRKVTYITWDHPIAIVMVIFVGVILCCVSFTFATIIKFRNTPVMVYSSPEFLLLSLSGLTLLAVSTLFWIDIPNEARCTSRAWVGFVGYAMVITPLVSKTWRVWKIFKPRRKLRRISLTNFDLIKYTAIILAIYIVVLIFWTAFDMMKRDMVYSSTVEAYIYHCVSKSSLWSLSLFVVSGILLIALLVLSIQTRRSPIEFRETHWINIASFISIFMTIIGLSLGYTLSMSPIAQISIIVMCLLFGSFGIWITIFFPKIYVAIITPQKNVVMPKYSKRKKQSTGDLM